MDKSWMTKFRSSREYMEGVKSFVSFTVCNFGEYETIVCPCKKCRFNKRRPPQQVYDHLTGGIEILPNYTEWVLHGEKVDVPAVQGSNLTWPAIDIALIQDESTTMHAMSHDQDHHDKAQPPDVPIDTPHTTQEQVRRALDGTMVKTIDAEGNFHVRDAGGVNDIWGIPRGEKVILELNSSGQPIGTSGKKWRRFGGKCVRSGKFVSLAAPHWKRVEMDRKEQIWSCMMMKFYIPPDHPIENIKHLSFQDFGKKRKDYKYRVKKSLKIRANNTLQSILASTSNIDMFDAEDYEITI